MNFKSLLTTKETRKSVILLVCTFLGIAILFFLIINARNTVDNNISDITVVATINGEEVIAREFRALKEKHSSEVRDYFLRQHGVYLTMGFTWENSYDGEIPNEMLFERVKQDLINLKTNQILLKKHGAIEDTSYTYFLDKMHQRGVLPSSALRNIDNTLRPISNSEVEEFSNIITEKNLELKNVLLQEEIIISEDEILKFYNYNEGIFSQYDEIYLTVISLSHNDVILPEFQEEQSQITKAEFVSDTYNLYMRINLGKDPYSFIDRYDEYSQVTMEISDEKVHELERDTDDTYINFLIHNFTDMEEDEVRYMSHSGTIYILKCTQRNELDFEILREKIIDILYEEKFEEFLEREIEKAEVVIYEDLIEGLR